jgi:hypothetical protein
MRVYTRFEHGGEELWVEKEGRVYVYIYPKTKERIRSTRQLLMKYYGKYKSITHERYFCLGRYKRGVPQYLSVRELMEEGKVRGIDLNVRGKEVEKILFSCFGNMIRSLGIEYEDLVQEVYKGILTRNRGKCAWDPDKSSFGHYVHMVCGCVLSNLSKKKGAKEEKKLKNEVENIENLPASEGLDLGKMEEYRVYEDFRIWMEKKSMSGKEISKNAMKILPYLCQGFKRSEIASKIGLDPLEISRALGYLRSIGKDWINT